jgi:NTE family protein
MPNLCRPRALVFAVALALVLGVPVAVAAERIDGSPRVALVLSGGGARGFAHIGVLRVLDRLRIPVDLVVGTSMGAAVGGAYAAGVSPDALEAFALGSDWSAILADRPPRSEQPIRRRTDDIEVPSRVELGIGPNGLVAPRSAAGSQALEAALRRLLPPGASDRAARAQPVEFAGVATDLKTGQRVDLHEAPLFAAIRASLSVPGLFPPFRYDGRSLVDGGLVRNLPVDLARALGADVVIAVNLGTPLADEAGVSDALGATQQMLNILTERNVRRSLRELRPQDVLIEPQLGAASFVDFKAARAAIDAGERATWEASARLAALALPEAAYAARGRRLASSRDVAMRPGNRSVASVSVVGTRIADPATLAAESRLVSGQRASAEDVQRAADRLYGRGDFERVDVRIDDDPDGMRVTFEPVELPSQRSRLRLGLQFGTDFREDTEVSVSALHLLPWLNAWGGELRTLLRAGSTARAAVEWWQPLGPGSEWFGVASARYTSKTEPVYVNERPFGLFGVQRTGVGLAAGRLIGDLGYASLGLVRSGRRDRIVLPDGVGDTLLDAGVRTIGTAAVFIDTREPIGFPERGTMFAAAYERPVRGGHDTDLGPGDALTVQAMQAFRVSEVSGHVYGEFVRSRGPDVLPALGGFLRLSGTPRNSLYADEAVLFGRLVLGVPVGAMPVGLGGAVRVGMSVEAANGYGDPSADLRSLGGVRIAGSLFTSVDTRFGPLYAAFGKTRDIRPGLYLLLGPYW